MREPLDVSMLPADLRHRPDIRGRSMHVTKIGHSYIVRSPEGRSHTVTRSVKFMFRLTCDCDAAKYNTECSHVVAVMQVIDDAIKSQKES